MLPLFQTSLALINLLFTLLFPIYSPEYDQTTGPLAIALYAGSGLIVAARWPRLWLFLVVALSPLTTDFYRNYSIWTGGQHYFNSILTSYFAVGSWLGISLGRWLGPEKKDVGHFGFSKAASLAVIMFTIVYLFSWFRAIDVNLFSSAASASLKGVITHFGNATRLVPNSDFYFLREAQSLASASLLSVLVARVGYAAKVTAKQLANVVIVSGVLCAAIGIASKFIHFGFYQVAQQQGINGIFPDIHSFASFVLMVGILCFYLLIRSFNASERGLVVAYAGGMLLCAYAVYLSGSRFNLFAMVGLSLVALLLLAKRSIKSAPSKIASASIAAVAIVVLSSQVSFKDLGSKGRYDFAKIYDGLASMNFEQVNRTLSFRPEVFRAAFRLTGMYPTYGIGAANFYRYGGEYDLGHSNYLAQSRGENAHNYFLQVLSERGIIGLLCFLGLIGVVLSRNKEANDDDKGILVVFMAGLLLGNVFGHTLLIWYFQVLFWLLFFWAAIRHIEKQSMSNPTPDLAKPAALGTAALLALFVADSLLIEHKIGYGRFCYLPNYWPDNATGGVVTADMVNKNRIKMVKPIGPMREPVFITSMRPDGGHFSSPETKRDRNKEVKAATSDWQPVAELPFREGQIFLSRCYIPMHYGENLDQRRLGFRANVQKK